MNLAIEKLPECHARVATEVPADEVRPIRDKVLGSIIRQAKIPGFRPGKVPRKIIEQKFAADLEDHTREEIVRSIFRKAGECGLKVLGVHKIDRQNFEEDGSFTFESEVVLIPEVAISESDYKDIPVQVTKVKVDDAMIQSSLKNIVAKLADYKPSEEAAEIGDNLSVAYHMINREVLEGQGLDPFAFDNDLGLAVEIYEDEDLRLKQGALPGLPEQLIGAKMNDEKVVTIHFGEDYFIEELANREVQYEVKVLAVLKCHLPVLDDALAQTMGCESIADLEERITLSLESRVERKRSEDIDRQILAHLSNVLELDLPPELIERETRTEVYRYVNFAHQQGIPSDDLESSKDMIFAGAGQRAIANLKARFVLSEIAKKEEIKVSNEELSKAVYMEAVNAKKSVKKFVKKLQDDETIDDIAFGILINKTIEFLRQHANITEVEADEGKAEVATME